MGTDLAEEMGEGAEDFAAEHITEAGEEGAGLKENKHAGLSESIRHRTVQASRDWHPYYLLLTTYYLLRTPYYLLLTTTTRPSEIGIRT